LDEDVELVEEVFIGLFLELEHFVKEVEEE
jgi:hypothetical protein